MIERFIQGRTSVFVDASNVYHSMKSLGFSIDYQKLIDYLREKTQFQRIYYYVGQILENKRQEKLLQKLEKLGYIVRKKEIKAIWDRSTKRIIYKGNLDVELVIDAIDTINEYDQLILFSGDSDFAALLKYLKKKRKRVLIISSKRHVARELLKEAKYINIMKLKEYLQFNGT